MKTFYFFIFLFFTFLSLNSQATVDFESGLPDGWTVDGGWKVGTTSTLGSEYFPFTGNDTKFVGTNDDGAGQSGHADGKLITDYMDFTSISNVLLQFDLYFFNGNYNGSGQETLDILYSEDGTNWNKITSIETFYIWTKFYYDVSSFVGGKNVKIAFEYKDGNNWNYGAGIDNVSIGEQPDYFAVVKPPAKDWTQIENPGDEASFVTTINYYGKLPLSNFKLVYSIDATDEQIIVGTGTLNSNDTYEFSIPGFELGEHTFNSNFVMNDTIENVQEEMNLAVIPPIPPFAMNDVDGVARDLHADLASGKKIILDFFASWCGPCQTSTPILNKVWKNHGSGTKDFQVYSITTEQNDNANKVRGLNWGGEYPAFAYSAQNRLMWDVFNSKYGQNAIPMFIFLCPDKENPGFSEVSWYGVGVPGTLESDFENAIASCVVPEDPGVYFVEDEITVNTTISDDPLVELHLNNTANTNINVYWELEKPDFNHSWESQVCDNFTCYSVNIDKSSEKHPNTINAGDTSLWTIHVYSHDIPDTGLVVLKIYDDKNFTNLLDSLPITLNIAKPNATIDIFTNDAIDIYPNPASDMIKVKFTLKKAMNTEVFITDNLGRVVKKVGMQNNILDYSGNVDISDFEKGIYFLNVKTKYGTRTKKIVKF